VTVRLLVQCEGTRADRPTVSLERCRAALPTTETLPAGAQHAARLAGWTQHHGRDLCPACSRSRAEQDPTP